MLIPVPLVTLLIRNSSRHGIWQEFHDNGLLAVEGWYKNGVKSGEWTWYDYSGNLIAAGVYERSYREYTSEEKAEKGLLETRVWVDEEAEMVEEKEDT